MFSPKPALNQSAVLFRVDASLVIGSGHVMRCLTLADVLSESGVTCVFVCRDLPGNLIQTVRAKGYTVHILAKQSSENRTDCSHIGEESEPPHSAWLEGHWKEDADDTFNIAKEYEPDWLVVDHYALDARWERSTAEGLRCRVFAIDDLADRSHEIDMLLDQNLGRKPSDYKGLISDDTTLLIGVENALLRPEFAENRARSLAHPRGGHGPLDIMVSLGGIDRNNATESVLASLDRLNVELVRRVTVVMGKNAPWIDSVKVRAANLRHTVEIAVDIGDMADRLSTTDLAIGAAGSSAWERCCLGVPSILITLADNQEAVASHLDSCGAAIALGRAKNIPSRLPGVVHMLHEEKVLQSLSKNAADVTDGQGALRVLGHMFPVRV